MDFYIYLSLRDKLDTQYEAGPCGARKFCTILSIYMSISIVSFVEALATPPKDWNIKWDAQTKSNGKLE